MLGGTPHGAGSAGLLRGTAGCLGRTPVSAHLPAPFPSQVPGGDHILPVGPHKGRNKDSESCWPEQEGTGAQSQFFHSQG